MACLVAYTDAFGQWWETLGTGVQDAIDIHVHLLEEKGPTLPFPYSSGIHGSRHGHMRELRVQSGGAPYRILYAFDPRRAVILLIGGMKAGDDRWYETHIPIADRLYDEHLEELRQEGLSDGEIV